MFCSQSVNPWRIQGDSIPQTCENISPISHLATWSSAEDSSASSHIILPKVFIRISWGNPACKPHHLVKQRCEVDGHTMRKRTSKITTDVFVGDNSCCLEKINRERVELDFPRALFWLACTHGWYYVASRHEQAPGEHVLGGFRDWLWWPHNDD